MYSLRWKTPAQKAKLFSDAEKTSEEIANEIFEVLSEGSSVIPWCKKVEKVTVTQA